MNINVLFVCLGNICRSPSAQGCLQQHVENAAISDLFNIDSCGTAAVNTGKPPDARAIAAASRAGVDSSSQVARQIRDQDFQSSDYIIAMDRINLSSIQAWAASDFSGETALLMRYTPQASNLQIADPYYEQTEKFDALIHSLQSATKYLFAYLRLKHKI